MNTESVVCSQCGAPLAIPAGVQFVSCNRCHAQLVVRREASITFTSALTSGASVQDVSDDLERLKIEQELARIDREWQMRREDLMVSGRYGHRHRPSLAGGVIVITMALIFGGIWTLVAFGMASVVGGPAMFFPFVGLVFIFGGILIGANMISKARHWEAEEAQYLERRAEVERRLNSG
jgi:LSD1 subclass zinc finger protein